MDATRYAVKKDVRNSPIVREVDERRQRAAVAVGRRRRWCWSSSRCSLGWQHFELLQVRVPASSRCSSERAAEEADRRGSCGSRSRRCGRPSGSSTLATERLHLVAPPARRASWSSSAVVPAEAPPRRRSSRRARSSPPWLTRRALTRWRRDRAGGACWSLARRVRACGRWPSRRGSSTCRSSSATSSRRAPSAQQKRPSTVPAKRGDILDRHGRVLAFSVDADSIYAVPSEPSGRPRRTAAAICAARSATARRASGRALAERLGGSRRSRTCGRQVSPDAGRARRGARALPGIGLHQGEPALLPEPGAGGARARLRRARQHAGSAGIEATYDAQIAGTPARCS